METQLLSPTFFLQKTLSFGLSCNREKPKNRQNPTALNLLYLLCQYRSKMKTLYNLHELFILVHFFVCQECSGQLDAVGMCRWMSGQLITPYRRTTQFPHCTFLLLQYKAIHISVYSKCAWATSILKNVYRIKPFDSEVIIITWCMVIDGR